MSGNQRLINSKLTSEGKIGSVVKALSGDTNAQTKSISKLTTKSVRGNNQSKDKVSYGSHK